MDRENKKYSKASVLFAYNGGGGVEGVNGLCNTSTKNPFLDSFSNPICKLNLQETSEFVKSFPVANNGAETRGLKNSLRLLKLRNAIDPKRHYKKGDSKSKTLPKYFQVGTVIESATEFYTGRLIKKERKASLADELLADRTLGDYRKRKIL